MEPTDKTKGAFGKWFDSLAKAPLLSILVLFLVVLFGIFLTVLFCDGFAQWITELLGRESKGKALEFIGIAMGGVILAIQATVANRRAKAMEGTADAQAKANEKTEQGQRQERLKNAIEHLGHEASSVRLGGAYELFHLAEDIEEWRQNIFQILCAHIRQTSGTSEYQDNHGGEPSTEIQSLLTLLFVDEHKVFQDFSPNLQGSWLNGASLNGARLGGADLRSAQLQGAFLQATYLDKALLQGAILQRADLRGADLRRADLQGALLRRAGLQGARLQQANLRGADLQGASLQMAILRWTDLPGASLRWADLRVARLQAADFQGADLQGASLRDAGLQSAGLQGASLQGADLQRAGLQGTDLQRANLKGANLHGASLQGAEIFGAHLQGVCSANNLDEYGDFVDRVQRGVGKKSDFSGVVFSGGLNKQNWDHIKVEIDDSPPLLKHLQQIFQQHMNKPPSNELPEDNGTHTGSYTQEDADLWIREYKELFRLR